MWWVYLLSIVNIIDSDERGLGGTGAAVPFCEADMTLVQAGCGGGWCGELDRFVVLSNG